MARRLIGIGAVVAGVTVMTAPAAVAHVTLQPGSLPKGANDVLVSFAAPNESTTGAATIALEVDLPVDHPLLGVHALAQPGWNVTVQHTTLAKPVETDDGTITSAVSRVVWTATGSGFGPDQFGLFTLLVGTLPRHTRSLTFKALQTSSDGTVIRWIEPIVKGAAEPEHPTPILKLTKAKKG